MKQLTGLDASFLYMETPTTFGHVTGLLIFERPSADFDPYAAVYAKFASLVGELTVPVSIRTGDECDPWTNRVSMIVADLPTDAPTRSNGSPAAGRR